jgi:hypothetical protein
MDWWESRLIWENSCIGVRMIFLKWFALWLGLAIIFACIAGRQCQKYYRLRQTGVTVAGVVQAKKPHMLIEYSFRANGQDYSGWGRGDVGSPLFDEISIGDRAVVHYLPNDPDINCLHDPAKLFHAELFPVLGVVLLFPTITVSALAFRFGNFLKGSTV